MPFEVEGLDGGLDGLGELFPFVLFLSGHGYSMSSRGSGSVVGWHWHCGFAHWAKVSGVAHSSSGSSGSGRRVITPIP